MNISVVIPVYNVKDTVKELFVSLIDQSRASREIIFVDNGSSDETVKILSELSSAQANKNLVKIISHDIRGPASCRNAGVAVAQGDVIAFIDGDCVAEKNWIKKIEEKFCLNEDISAIAGGILGYKPSTIVEKLSACFTLRGKTTEEKIFLYDIVSGGFPAANIAVKKECFEAVSGFASSLKYGEDHFLCYQLLNQLKRPILYSPDVKVYHQHRSDLSSVCRQAYHYGTAHGTLLTKVEPGHFIFELPGKTVVKRSALRMWIKLNAIEKYILAFILLTFLHKGFALLMAVHFIVSSYCIKAKGSKYEVNLTTLEAVQLYGLLLFKSTALSLGRIVGGIKNRVLIL